MNKDTVRALSNTELADLRTLLDDEAQRREETGFPNLVRGYLAEGLDPAVQAEIELGGGPVRLVFPTDTWDNGWWYAEAQGELTLNSGDVLEIDFSATRVSDSLTELSVIARREHDLNGNSVLIVDLINNTVSHDVNF